MTEDKRRFSSNNPFKEYEESNNSLSPNTAHQEQQQQQRRRISSSTSASQRDIRPISNLPVDDAFDYSGYQYDNDGAKVADDHNGSRSRVGSTARSEASFTKTPQLDSGFEFHNSNNRKYGELGVDSSTSQQRHISFAPAPSVPSSPVTAQSYSSNSNSNANSVNASPQVVVTSFENEDPQKPLETTVMKRHRWGTQRHKKGRPAPKRSKSIFKSRRVSTLSQKAPSVASHDNNNQSHSASDSDENNNADNGESDEQRRIYINMQLPQDMIDPETGLPAKDYTRNKIRTTKYTPLSFIPKNLYYQFQNVANIFFLFIVILGAFSIFGVDNPGLAAVPIIVIVTITAVKDAVEDYRRTVLDMELNNTRTQLLKNNHNYNVTDDNVSLWRRFKKANTRLVIRVARALKNKKKKKNNASSGDANDDDNELTRSTTIHSIYSGNDPHVDEEGYNMSEIKGSGSSGGSSNPFDPPMSISSNNESVMDLKTQTPGKAKFKREFWKNVRVGDFVRIRNNDEIPADLVVLATSDADGACYVETKNLDGETNLKVRQALKCGQGIKHSLDCERAKFWIESEGPHANLYAYNGAAKWITDDGDEKVEPISINNVLLRGCALRNTDWVIGVTLFTGVETKIMLNAGVTPTKRSQISRELNISVFTNFALLFVLCFVSGTINGTYYAQSGTSIDYFEFGSIGGSPPVNGLVTFWADVILYQSVIPISLYISIEIVKTIQAFFIYSDCYMYYEPIDYPCTPKSWNISDDLGQVEYVFSDKTGTLTQNVMEFKKCTINGIAYGKAYTEALAGMRKREGANVEEEIETMRAEIVRDRATMLRELRKIDDNDQLVDDEVTFVSSMFVRDLQGDSGDEQERACKHFMLILALCHSVIAEPSKANPNRREFKAQSPDEAALVATARDMGFTFVNRTQQGVIINVQGQEEEFQILNTLEFNSTRKRMSAIVKFKGEDGQDKISLICKGADSVIYSRLRANEQERLRQETACHLEQFAQEGLRTLCLAQRELTVEQYHEWNRRHEEASAALTNREEKMEEVADSIERDLTLLGGTAIEDRLQEGVPQSISHLGDAGIKLWVLTGDKVETAINIGFSCNVLDNSMELLILRAEEGTKESCSKLLHDYLDRYFGMTGSDEELEFARNDHSPPNSRYAVIVDGDTLKLALDDELRTKFLLLCKQCKSVLCCRVSPAQKADVVRLVKNTLKVMTLSIGDGANDVAMIQEADVGIGIAGEEGRQAAMSSDYAIGQFRFLTRLLLVHGRWSYKRLAEMIPNFFYKNVVFTLSLFWYGLFTSFDGTYLYEYTFVMFFNLAFTSLPVIFLGFLDQDVDDRLSLAVPQLYQRGILRMEWHQKKFWTYMIDGIYQSFISFFFPYFAWWTGGFEDMNGRPLNHRFWFGLATCSIAVFSCNLYVLSNQYRWDWVSVLIGFISSMLVFFWSGVYSSTIYSGEFYGAATEVFGSAIFWAVVLVGIAASLLPHFAYMTVQKLWMPMDVDIIRENWYMGEYDSIPGPAENEKEKDLYSSSGSSPIEQQHNKWTQHQKGPLQDDTQNLVVAESNERKYSESINDFYDNDSMYGMKPTDSYDVPPVPDISDLPTPQSQPPPQPRQQASGATRKSYHKQRASLDMPRSSFHYSERETRASLEQIRNDLRMEQAPPRESLDNIRTSMDLKDMTTAEGLMRMTSRQ